MCPFQDNLKVVLSQNLWQKQPACCLSNCLFTFRPPSAPVVCALLSYLFGPLAGLV